jgi:hypothetical protein
MMSESTIAEDTKIVPLFRTYAEMQQDECAIYKEHYDAWHAAYRRWDLVNAALADDDTELNKLAASDPEMALAKSDAERLRKLYHPEISATAELASTLRKLCEKRNERLYGLGALARRSQRFASAHANRSFGPAAESLPPAS